MESILRLFPETQTQAVCANHPQHAALQLCDHCNRFLCGDCLGEAVNLPARAFYYCFDAACEAAYQQTIKRRLLLALFLVPIVVIYFLQRDLFYFGWLFMFLPQIAQDVKLIQAYRRRQSRHKQTLADAPSL